MKNRVPPLKKVDPKRVPKKTATRIADIDISDLTPLTFDERLASLKKHPPKAKKAMARAFGLLLHAKHPEFGCVVEPKPTNATLLWHSLKVSSIPPIDLMAYVIDNWEDFLAFVSKREGTDRYPGQPTLRFFCFNIESACMFYTVAKREKAKPDGPLITTPSQYDD